MAEPIDDADRDGYSDGSLVLILLPRKNGQVVDVEALAVSAVAAALARCSHLSGRIDSNDKTPLTDGAIDVYNSPDKKKSSLAGRVPVQVKGRTTTKKIKRKAQSVGWSIDRETLEFMRADGGGLYFFVPVTPEGNVRGIFYAALMPFKIGRWLETMPAEQKTITVAMTRLPGDVPEIERLVRMALEGRKQLNPVNLSDLLPQLESLTVTALTHISGSEPTVLNLSETDFTVVVKTKSGSVIPIDVDLAFYPEKQRQSVSVACGGVEFAAATVERIGDETSRIVLSAGLSIRARRVDDGLTTNIDLTRAGTLFAQYDDVRFFLAAAAGEPLVINGQELPPLPIAPADRSDLLKVRDQLKKMIAVIKSFDLGREFERSIYVFQGEHQHLLMLHPALIGGEEVRVSTDGVGRLNLSVGPFQIVVLVFEGATADHRQIVDPFAPEQRNRLYFRQTSEDDHSQAVRRATLYEALTPDDLGKTLNLHLDEIVEAYEMLEDRPGALAMANQTTLNLLLAADDANSAAQTAYLLRGARNLTDWLQREGDSDPIYSINSWQVKHRLGTLDDNDRRTIRQERRRHRYDGALDALAEACLAILLDERDEVESILQDMSEDDRSKVRGWPIWALRKE